MRRDYDKLVRDHIPEIIRQAGCECEVVVMSEEEYRQALGKKLVEEAQEAAVADAQDLVKELADLSEVIDAVLSVYRIDRELVLREQERRRVERGGFSDRLKLLWTSVESEI